MDQPGAPRETLGIEEIALSDIGGFWTLPLAEREGAFATLRRERPISFFEEPEIAGLPRGPGYWAVTRYADVVEASRQPDAFCSGQGVTSVIDLRALLARLADIHPAAEPVRLRSHFINGIRHMPVEFTPQPAVRA